ncbi:MAG: hypothetical protein IPK50_19705 [Fibrobacterota bacterium]|nr:MAG: hypothetical protein IPK50_19705 [Fibrobacterota bacterium]
MKYPFSLRNWALALAFSVIPSAHAQTAINLSKTYQTIDGFGGMNFPRWQPGLTDSGADMTETAFGTGSGQVGLSILRINMDPDSVDWKRSLAVTKAAQAHGVKIFASQWSVPLSMKTTGKLIGGRLKTESYGAYAAYMNTFIDYMKAAGVEIYAMSPTNEPDCPVMYETTEWSASEVTAWVKNHGATVKAKILAAETFQFNKSYADMILADATAAANLDIVGAHPYGISNIASVMAYPKAAEKGKALWMTEHYTTTSGTNPQQANLWPDALEAGKEVHTFMTIHYNAYVWWYIRRNYGLISDDGKITKRGAAFSQFARFVRPGFVRVDVPASPSNGVQATAYKKGSDVVVVLINTQNSTATASFTLTNPTGTIASFKKYTTSASKTAAEDGTITVTNNAFSVPLEAQSINTLVYTAVSSARPGTVAPDTDLADQSLPTGDYLVFDLAGARVATVSHTEGKVLEAELGQIVGQTGLYVVKSVGGELSRRVTVTLE